jgi:hypothetical protein
MEIRPSPHLALLLLLFHGLALMSTAFVPGGLGLPLALLVLASLIHVLRREALRSGAGSIVLVRYEEGDRYLLHLKERGEMGARLLAGGHVSPWLTVLRFRKDDGRVVSLLLMPDAVDAEDFRRLRIQARRG